MSRKIGQRLNSGVMSSAQSEWQTPTKLFAALNDVFRFDFDAAANASNTKCKLFLDSKDDALGDTSWRTKLAKKYRLKKPHQIGTGWLNSPYGSIVALFIRAVIRQSREYDITVVVLAAARTETRWFREANEAARYRIDLYQRLRFTEPGCAEGFVFVDASRTSQKRSAPAFPSTLFVFTRRDDMPVYDLRELGFVIDLEMQRKAA